jgi:hypothetical protein
VVRLAQQPVESRVKARMTPFCSRERLDGRATGAGPLSGQDLAELDALDETGGTASALERKWW